MVMVTFKPVRGVAAEACADTAQIIFIYKWFLCHAVNGTEKIVHTLPAPVAADFIIPLLSERRKAAAVRSYDDISVSSHQLEVPSVGKKLADGALRAALAVK